LDSGAWFDALQNLQEENDMENCAENKVTIVDVKMPFMSMVIFRVKATIAAIPAFIILAILGAIVGSIFAGVAAR
jgi:hypothetical protein